MDLWRRKTARWMDFISPERTADNSIKEMTHMLPFYLFGERCVVLFILYLSGTRYIEHCLIYNCVWLYLLRSNDHVREFIHLPISEIPVKLLDSFRGAEGGRSVMCTSSLLRLCWSWLCYVAEPSCAVGRLFYPPSPSILSGVRPQLWVMLHGNVTAALILICEQITDLFFFLSFFPTTFMPQAALLHCYIYIYICHI